MLLKAIDLLPTDSKTWANLATLYERQNKKDDAAKAIAKALEQDPENNLALKVSASLEQAEGDREKALTLMTQLAQKAATWGQKESIYFELAQLHDKLGNIDDAYETFTTANQLHRDAAVSRHVDPQTFLSQVTREAEILKTNPPEHQAVEPAINPPDPVFLMGFPRSGTTLLDQVLDSHPGAAVMEERPPLADVHSRLTELENDSGQYFTSLDEEQLQVARHYYFQRVVMFMEDFEDKIFIDKQPLGTAKIRIIKLFFPNAKILFSLRHPCDVVLSCFMQRFKINVAMANFYSLEDAAKAYAMVMNLWLASNKGLGLPVHFVRYENLVTDFDTEVGQALEFLGLPWDDRVVNFHEHALGREVRTASLRQVTQPLYTTALARWQRYAKYMEPYMETLQPFIDAFGYSSEIEK